MRDFATELAELRQRYVQSLPQKLDELAALLEAWRLPAARALAHRLRGTAGSYGVTAFGARAGAVEDAIDALPHDQVATPALTEQFRELVRAARAELTAVTS